MRLIFDSRHHEERRTISTIANRLTLLVLSVATCGGASADDRFPTTATSPSESAPNVAQAHVKNVTTELRKQYPQNRLVRIVFHGHSVPAGYFRTPIVRRFDSYPMLFHRALCEAYPTATIDVCVTAIGGETSASGARRFQADVLSLKPDLVFIDYNLNDRRIGLKRAEESWRSMILACRKSGIPVVLLTATPDSREDILDADAPLMKHSVQVRRLGTEFA